MKEQFLSDLKFAENSGKELTEKFSWELTRKRANRY
jgi:hypothetical protein